MPRPDRRAERIPQIIQAAMVVFARNGFAATRMEDIAHAAGLSKAAIYLYFASKEEVIIAILQAFFDRGFDELNALRDAAGSVSHRLQTWTQQRMHEMQTQTALLSIGFEFHAVAARDPATQQVMQRYYDQYRQSMASLIVQGIERGEFPAIDAQQTALALISLYEGLTVLWMLDPDRIDLTSVAEKGMYALLRGMR
jgi:AcrR family transcriptional regulator